MHPCFQIDPAPPVRVDTADRRIAVRGELDVSGVAALNSVLREFLGGDPGDVTIDASDLTFIDAAGMGCLVGFATQLFARGSTLLIVGTLPRVRRVFGIVSLEGMLAPR